MPYRQEPTLYARLAVALAALFAMALGIWHLQQATAGLVVSAAQVGEIPVTVWRPEAAARAPVIVIAHGFAGSQQLMRPFAITLARNGYICVTFDFPGHGRNPLPLSGGLAHDQARNRALIDSLGAVVSYAQALPQSDGRVGLLGHSMGSETVVSYAQAHPGIAATVAVSPFLRGITADSPRDLLIIIGALEPAMLRDEARRVVGLSAGGAAQERVTYGDFAAGTARRLSLSGGVEHIGVLYSAQSMREALDWMNQAFNHQGDGYLGRPAPWLGWLFGGLVALAWPLSRLLPVAATARLGAGLPWSRLWAVALIPMLLTPLLLWQLPTDFLPILLGDYLVVHFAVYGLLTLGVWLLLRRRERAGGRRTLWRQLATGSLLVAGYCVFAIGIPIDTYLTAFLPTFGRAPLILAMLAGTLPYFLADEWVTRGATSPWGGYAATKLCFVISLMLAVALNLHRLFFLIIIVPVILIFFIVYGLFSTWAFRRTRHPLVGALANALAFAWAIAVTFPVVG